MNKTHQLKRHLDATEESLGRKFWYSRLTVQYVGFLDEEILRQAFSALYEQYPILRGRIYPDDRGYVLDISEDFSHPDFITLNGSFKLLLEKFAENDARGNSHSALSQLIHSRGSSVGYVTLGVNHAVVDGVNQWHFLRKLWEHYTNLVQGEQFKFQADASLPIPPGEIVKERWGSAHFNQDDNELERDYKTKFETQIYTRKPSAKKSVIKAVRQTRIFRFDQENTSRLRLTARRHGLSVGDYLVGVAVAGMQKCDPIAESGTIKIGTLHNLRKYLDPPVMPEHSTYLSAPFRAHVRPSTNWAEIGMDFANQLNNAVRSRALAPLNMDELMNSQSVDFSISNLGANAIPTPKGLEIVDYFPLRVYLSEGETEFDIRSQSGRLSLTSWACNGLLTLAWKSRPDLASVYADIAEKIHETNSSLEFSEEF